MPWKKNKHCESYDVKYGRISISVHRIIDRPGKWYLSGHFFDRVLLASDELKYAKCQAKAMLQVILQTSLNELLKDIERG